MLRDIAQRSTVLACIAIASLGPSTHAQQIRKANDIVSQVQNLKFRGDPMGFRVPGTMPNLSGPNHWQGIARHPDPDKPYFYAVASGPGCTELQVIRMGTADSRSGYRIRSNRLEPDTTSNFTAPPSTDRVVNTIPLPDTHGGGMQTAGKYLAIPLGFHENCVTEPYEQQPRIAIYDISRPETPVLARMLHDQDDVNYSSGYNSIPGSLAELGFVQRDDGSFFLIGAFGANLWYWTLSEDLSRFEHINAYTLPEEQWTGNGNGYAFQSYQLINPLGETTTDGSEILYMLGLQNFSNVGAGADYVWVYRMVLSSTSTVTSMVKVLQTEISSRTSPENIESNGNFAAGGSAWISPTGGLLVYSCDYYIRGLENSVTMSEFCDRSGDAPATVPADGCTAQVFLYTDADYGGKVLAVDALDYDQKNFLNLFVNHEGTLGFSDNVTSLTWRLPPGCVARLYAQMNQNGEYLELSGAGSISDLGGVSWTSSGQGNANNAISSVAFVGASTPAPVRYLSPAPAFIVSQLAPVSPCSMLKLTEGVYAGPAVFDRKLQIYSTGGIVRLGAP